MQGYLFKKYEFQESHNGALLSVEALRHQTGCTPQDRAHVQYIDYLLPNCSASDNKTEMSDPSWLLGNQFCIIRTISCALISAKPHARL